MDLNRIAICEPVLSSINLFEQECHRDSRIWDEFSENLLENLRKLEWLVENVWNSENDTWSLFTCNLQIIWPIWIRNINWSIWIRLVDLDQQLWVWIPEPSTELTYQLLNKIIIFSGKNRYKNGYSTFLIMFFNNLVSKKKVKLLCNRLYDLTILQTFSKKSVMIVQKKLQNLTIVQKFLEKNVKISCNKLWSLNNFSETSNKITSWLKK